MSMIEHEQWLMTRKQQQFIKQIKKELKESLVESPDDDDQARLQHALVRLLFAYPDEAERNIYMVWLYGNYKTRTAMGEELNLSKQTVSNAIQRVNRWIKAEITALQQREKITVGRRI